MNFIQTVTASTRLIQVQVKQIPMIGNGGGSHEVLKSLAEELLVTFICWERKSLLS